MSSIHLSHSSGVPAGKLELPASKSISNRLAIIAHLSKGKVRPLGLSKAGDTEILMRGLGELDSGTDLIDLADAGTAMRFMTALCSIVPGERILTGTDRMKERPLGPLVEALRALGAEIEYLEQAGRPPVKVKGKALKGGDVEVRGDVSSQFLSALALIAPVLEKGLNMQVQGGAVSTPYFRMTLEILSDLGVSVREEEGSTFIAPSGFPEKEYRVERDHSSAAFWYEFLALKEKGGLFLEALFEHSHQGDRVLPDYFRSLGVRERWDRDGVSLEAVPGSLHEGPYETDMRHQPDLVPAVVVTLAGLGKKGIVHGVQGLRSKESDRIEALKTELAKVGVELVPDGDQLGIDPDGFDPEAEPRFASYNDHRIVMALAPLSAILPNLWIEDPEVVKKSYPDYWKDLERVDPSLFQGG